MDWTKNPTIVVSFVRFLFSCQGMITDDQKMMFSGFVAARERRPPPCGHSCYLEGERSAASS